ncbi:MAG: histidine phosphatase family protein [Burkholderiaceae bacterium]|nr:histidine phosphatase family protein [Burkholderiaceae bacterium]
MQRRSLLTATLTSAVATACAPTLWAGSGLAAQARRGGVLLIRHASTEPGVGDPPGFRLGQCSTQRNLSDVGRAEARAMGQWFRRQGLQAQAVRSSQWCRCQDTARIAFSRFEDWPALNSTFADQGDAPGQLRALRERLQTLPPGVLEVWITHQVIMTGLTGVWPATAEGFVVDRRGDLLARGMMAA